MDDGASCLVGDLGCDGLPFGFVCEVFDLDEFVVVEGLVDVGVGGFGDAVSADLDSGFEAVGLFLEGAYLSRCEWVHGGSVFLRFLNWFLFAGVVWGVAGRYPPVLGVSGLELFLGFVGCLGGFLVCLGVVLILNSY